MKSTYAFRFFFDWGSSGECLWPDNEAARRKFGLAPPIEDFPLSGELKAQTHQIGEWYQSALNRDYPPDPGPWRQEECDRFNRAVRELFSDIVRELGNSFTVEYLQAEQIEDPDLDDYLKDPAHFKRKK